MAKGQTFVVVVDPDGVDEGRDVLFHVLPRETVLGECAPKDHVGRGPVLVDRVRLHYLHSSIIKGQEESNGAISD